jgi:hypothetical protein
MPIWPCQATQFWAPGTPTEQFPCGPVVQEIAAAQALPEHSRLTKLLADLRLERRPCFLFVGETMIRHASPSRTVTATSGGVHGATTWSCLIAPPSFPLFVATGFLRAGSNAVDMTSITPATDKHLGAAASTQKHSARNLIDTCGSASPALRITALCIYIYQFWQ